MMHLLRDSKFKKINIFLRWKTLSKVNHIYTIKLKAMPDASRSAPIRLVRS